MINTAYPIHNALAQNQVVIRALTSITSKQADAVTRIVQACGQGWDVHAVNDYDGYLSLLIEPTISGDQHKALFVAGTAQRLELFEAQDDDLTPISSFTDIQALGARLTELIGPQ